MSGCGCGHDHGVSGESVIGEIDGIGEVGGFGEEIGAHECSS